MASSQHSGWKRLSGAAAATTLVTAAMTVGMVTPAHAEVVPITILSVNDFHGRINDDTLHFAATIESLRQTAGADNTLLIGAGDLIGASEFASSIENDQPTIDVFNELDMVASAVGNHEFDKGFADLTDRVVPAADWDYLGANVYEAGTTTPALPEYALANVAGVTVGIIGVVTQETPTLVSPAGVAGLSFGDPVAALNRVADQLTDDDPANGEADVLIASVHEGSPIGGDGVTLADAEAASPVFASIVNDTSAKISVILNGHTHQEYAFAAPVPGVDGATRPVIQTGNYAQNVGAIQFTYDTDTGVVGAFTAVNVPTLTEGTDADILVTYPQLAGVNATVQAALANAAAVGNEPVGSVTADITTAFSGGSYGPTGYAGGTRDNRAAESALGNLVADALLTTLEPADLGGADISLVNPGGLRAELLYGADGVITYAEANGVLPFINNLYTTTLTGTQLVAVLEQQWQTVEDADGNVSVPSRPYLQLGSSSNLSWTYDADPDKDGVTVGDLDDQGKHILSVSVGGKPVLVDDTFRVGSFSFLLEGGDNFTAFTDGTDTRDSGLIDRDAWIDFLRANPGISPSFAKHAVALTSAGPLPGGGETATLNVSNLDMTSLGAPAASTLEAGYISVPSDGTEPVLTEIGSFPVAGGATDVTFTVPGIGSYLLVLGVEATETVVSLPLVVLTELPPAPVTTTVTTPTTVTSATTVTATTTAKPTKGKTTQLASTGISEDDSTSATLVATALILLGSTLVVAARRRQVTGRHQG